MKEQEKYMVFQIDFGTPEFDEALRLRYTVLREPLGLDYTAEQIAEEYSDIHIGLYLPSGRLGAYLCFRPLDQQTWKMRQVAVAPELQGKGIGTQLVKAAEQYAIQHQINCITMHARDTAVPFYTRLAYRKIGDLFEEVGIPHYKMEKTLA